MAGADVVVTNSASPISFLSEGGGAWKIWDRYIALDGKRAFHIGNVCGTCSFLFARLDGATRSIDVGQLVSELNAGVTQLRSSLLDALKEILPDGRYRATLLRTSPELVYPGGPRDYFATEQLALWGLDTFCGLPHTPNTEYYRLGSRLLGDNRALFEFVVPTFSHGGLDDSRLEEYTRALRGGALPTAVAVSVLDVKQPAVWDGDPEITSHWCLAHYLLDGHHKVFAASRAGLPCTLLSFLAVDQGVSSLDDVAMLRQLLEGEA